MRGADEPVRGTAHLTLPPLSAHARVRLSGGASPMRQGPLPLPLKAGLSGENFSARIASLEFEGSNLKSSCADLIRVSTSLFRAREGVDGRDKPGQDENGGRFPPFPGHKIFPGQPCPEGGEGLLLLFPDSLARRRSGA